MVADVERALRWVQANAAGVGGDVHGRVAIVGQSAGAHLTALLLLRVRAQPPI
jgi:acetyl esterase/lipase